MTEELKIMMGVDAGAATGIAIISTGDDGLWSIDSLRTEEIVGRYEAEKQIASVLHSGYDVTVVAERFTITERTTKTKRQYDTLYINGYMDGLCHSLGLPYHELTPAESKGFGEDPKLRRLGWYEKTSDGHANDAARLVLTGAFRWTPGRIHHLAHRLVGE